jgi:hypothetical protein
MRTIVTLFFLLAVATSLEATDLRGRIDGTHGFSAVPFPAVKVQVTLLRQNGPNSLAPIIRTFSGPDGMYYLKGIQPGSYVLQINGVNYPLNVTPVPTQDIQAILVRF